MILKPSLPLESPTALAKRLGVSRQRAHQLMHREARNAREVVKHAVSVGIILKPLSCSRCGKVGPLEAHPSDYQSPLTDIQWLCHKCKFIVHPRFVGEPKPPKPKIQRPRRNATGKGKATQVDAALRFMILSRDGFHCRYCGAGTEDGAKLQVDHIVSIADGGLTIASNLITSCRTCNLGKRYRSLVQGQQIPSFLAVGLQPKGKRRQARPRKVPPPAPEPCAPASPAR